MKPDCGAMFHHTTARGYCSNCGGSWKHRRRKTALGEVGGTPSDGAHDF